MNDGKVGQGVRWQLSVGALTAEQWHLLATDVIRGVFRTRFRESRSDGIFALVA